jgi:hypothetical protein
MVRSKGKVAKQMAPLSNTEKDVLTGQRSDLVTQLKDLNEFGTGTAAAQIDKGAIQRQINRIDQTIAEREPPKISGTRKDELLKEAEQIKEQLRVGMPTREEMAHPAKNPGAVRKHMRWDVKNRLLIERFRTIQLLVNSDDPESVENLRKEK